MSQILRLNLSLNFAEFLEAQGDAVLRPGLRVSARRALEQAADLVSGAIVYDWFRVGEVGARDVEVGGAVFQLGRHAELMGPAESALLAVMTIGPRVEELAGELQKSGQALDSFLLSEAGVFGVGRLMEEAHRIAERDAAQRCWGVGAELAPGQLAGWSIAEQKLLCSLVDIDAIGVRLTESGMLVPQKSASMMVGIGPGYESNVVRAPCEFCDQKETCRYRH